MKFKEVIMRIMYLSFVLLVIITGISIAANPKRIHLNKFSIEAIEDWKTERKNNEIIFISPNATFDEICIRIGNSTKITNKTIEEVWGNYKKHISPKERSVISEEKLFINNNKWIGEIYTYELCNTKLKSIHLLTVSNGVVYSFQYISTEKDYDKYLPFFFNAQKTIILK